MRALMALILLVHGWYPQDCCGGTHCHPVPCEEIRSGPNQTLVWNGITFLNIHVHPSQDRYCHVCTSGPNGLCAFIRQDV
jgi:hypothetical protein